MKERPKKMPKKKKNLICVFWFHMHLSAAKKKKKKITINVHYWREQINHFRWHLCRKPVVQTDIQPELCAAVLWLRCFSCSASAIVIFAWCQSVYYCLWLCLWVCRGVSSACPWFTLGVAKSSLPFCLPNILWLKKHWFTWQETK